MVELRNMNLQNLISSVVLSKKGVAGSGSSGPVTTPPQFTSAPVINGSPTVGIPISFISGTVIGNPTPTVSVQWLLNNVIISGATGITYTPVSGDLGKLLSVRQTADNGIGSPAISTSNQVVINDTQSISISIGLTSSTTNNTPFTVGQPFRQGNVPAGQSLVLQSPASGQIIPKNYWPDGSLKFAIVSGITNLTANTTGFVTIVPGTPPQTPSLTTIDLQNSVTAPVSVTSVEFGNASWSSTDWLTPFQTWISGPYMSNWIFRKPIGSDPHLVAWIDVRLYSNGNVEIFPWIENGYLNVVGPTLKTGTFTFNFGNTTRFNASVSLPHHTRTPLINGAQLSYWMTTDSSTIPLHDKTYIQSTELVPTYDIKVTSLTSGYSVKAATSYQPLQQGDYKFGPDQTDNMANSGYGEPIGLLPGWEAKYLNCTSNLNEPAYSAVLRNGFSLGRYPIHYRDETTNVPILFSQYPTMALYDPRNNGSGFASQGSGSSYTPAILDASGTNLWDTAHSPAAGFLPYILTGRPYFIDECLFAGTINFLGSDAGPTQRTGILGLQQPDYGAWQVRSCAWALRTLAHTLAIIPDDDVTGLRTNFINCIQSNIDHYHNQYVAQPNNPLGGFIDWDPGPQGSGEVAPWQIDFMCSVFGMMLSLGLPLSTAYTNKLHGVLDYSARNIIGRLGINNNEGWWWINAFIYQMSICPVYVPDWKNGTGPWFSNFKEAYNVTFSTPPSWLGSSEGTIALEFPSPGDGARGFLANGLPAISYAVRHGIAGALDAYNRLITALNFDYYRPGFQDYPLWFQRPASGTDPQWLINKTSRTWFTIPNTSGAGGSLLNAYSGFGLTPNGELIAGAAGGHGTGSFDNRVVSINVLDNVPAWTVRIPPSTNINFGVSAYNNDGLPKGRHTYSSTIYAPYISRMMLLGYRYDIDQNQFNKVDGIDPSIWQWDGIVPGNPGAAGSGYADPSGTFPSVRDMDGNMWWFSHGDGSAVKYTVKTNSWSSQNMTTKVSPNVRYPWACNTRDGSLFGLSFGDGEESGTGLRSVLVQGTTEYQIVFNPSSAYNQILIDQPSYAGMDYDPVNNNFLFYSSRNNGPVYVITPNSTTTWDIDFLNAPGTAFPTNGAPIVNKLKYVPLLRGFVCLPDANSNLYFIKTG